MNENGVKQMYKHKDHTRNGLVLVLVVAAIAIFAIMALAMAALGYQSRIHAVRTQHELAAREAADAGHDAAVYELNRQLESWAGTLPQQPVAVPLPGGNQSYTYAVTPTPGAPLGSLAFDITGVGTSGNTQRWVFSRTILSGVFDYAAVVKDRMEFNAKVTIDGYDSTQGSYGSGNSGIGVQMGTNDDDDGDITLKNGVDVSGDSLLIVGHGAVDDPYSVVDDKTGVEHDVVAALEDIPFPDVTMPTAGLTNLGRLEVGKNDTVTIAAGSYLYDGIEVEQFATLEIEGDVVLNVLAGGILLKTDAELVIKGTPNSSLELYLAGNFEAMTGGNITNDTSDPTKLKLYGTSGCQSIILKNDSDFFGGIYAPYAYLDIRNSGDIYGSFVGDKMVLHNSVNFIYDAALGNVLPTDPGVRFVPRRWREE